MHLPHFQYVREKSLSFWEHRLLRKVLTTSRLRCNRIRLFPVNAVALVQVPAFCGAGGAPFWRRCDFRWETCAAAVRRIAFCGAGPHPFSTPAPAPPYTCASNALDLRHDRPAPAPGARVGERLWLETYPQPCRSTCESTKTPGIVLLAVPQHEPPSFRARPGISKRIRIFVEERFSR